MGGTTVLVGGATTCIMGTFIGIWLTWLRNNRDTSSIFAWALPGNTRSWNDHISTDTPQASSKKSSKKGVVYHSRLGRERSQVRLAGKGSNSMWTHISDNLLVFFPLIKWYWGKICLPSFVCLFDLIHYVPSTIFQLYRDGSSWVDPVIS